MAKVDISPFLLIDPPTGAEEQVRRDLSSITFPFNDINPLIETDPNQRIDVIWGELPDTVSARYLDRELTIVFNEKHYNPNNSVYGRTLAHEIGHMVDYVYLDQSQRRQLLDLFLKDSYHRLDGHKRHPWKGTYAEEYYARMHEAWADVFVATYAPTLFFGIRYHHHISDSALVKNILSKRVPMQIEKLAGADRYDTACRVSRERYPYNTPVEVVVVAEGTPDVASATAYAALDGRTLLFVVSGNDNVPESTLKEIGRLRFGTSVWKMTFVGGTAVVTEEARRVCRRAGGDDV